jgi:alkaline phosphatase D
MHFNISLDFRLVAKMLSSLVVLFSLAAAVTANYDGNLNYHSPSRRHPSLGIDVPKLVKRSLRARSSWDPSALKFTHGVASGDPYPESVILWTRISPTLENDRSNKTVEGTVPLYNHDTEIYIKSSSNPICVEYHVGVDQNFTKVVDKGTAYTTSDIDYTVKVSTINPIVRITGLNGLG